MTAHLVIIFYDLMEEANGLTCAGARPTVAISENTAPSEPLLVATNNVRIKNTVVAGWACRRNH